MSPGREAACRAVFGTWVFFRPMHGKTAPSCRLHSQGGVRRGVRASGSYQEGTGESGCFATWKHPRGHVWNVVVRPASSRGATGRSGTPSRQSRGVDPPVEIRRVEGAQRKWCRKTSVFLSRETGMPGNFVGAHQGCQVPFRPPIPNVGLLLRRCSGKGLHLPMTGEARGFSRVAAGLSSYDREFGMPLVLAQGSPISHPSCEGKLGIALERSEEHTSELQSPGELVCRLLLEKKKASPSEGRHRASHSPAGAGGLGDNGASVVVYHSVDTGFLILALVVFNFFFFFF